MSALSTNQETILSELHKINQTLIQILDNVTRAMAASSALSTLGNAGTSDSTLVREQGRALASARAIVEALSTPVGGAEDSDDE